MKILHILDHSIPLHSGYTFRTRAILEQQRKLGWETAHITSSKHTAEYQDTEEVDGLLFYRTRPSESALTRLPLMNQMDVINSLTKRLDQVISIEKPDVLHAHSPSLNGIAAIRAGRKHNLPVVYECRAFWEDAAVDHGTSKEWGLRYRITRALETYAFKNADAVTTICSGLKGDIQARGIRPDKITVIPNAVDLVHFSQRQDADDRQLSDELKLTDKKVLGFIGSFYAYEGLLLLVSALPDILKKAPDTRLLLVGGGPDDAKLKQLSNELGLQDKIIFTGRVPHADVTRYYNLVDIFVYPRLHMRLTDLVTPLKPLEAMAQEKLVLASDVGGHKELIRDGENGRLFRAGDKTSLANAALDMIKKTDDSSELRRNGLEYVEKERNWVVSVANYKNVYSALLAGE
ncbi:TIGR04063 family PEP-CTERM/XrtA system glycosyltransferase [Sedimenticola selenatireducens]|uniref:Glycosyltransferase, exosortase A system-associated n=1 Tax=Sedimenticola selenatireducens TaxID=191960 RepID=A0A557S848_9GAMM|nr:TIGR04063 family PEP-CTERM/XrtA system glycosyltransferase [Sedimenticola selenatireducens]TVO73576.1 glycosyltransferase, exosortase A system-associated [Sedimenticola selenatireducens]TVT63516.1 MAG: glycosyltransferase, exosortase A system-associated [Sedimenticola selenatireducens]